MAVTTPQNRKDRYNGHHLAGHFYHYLVNLSVGILGDASSGGHQAVMTELLERLNREGLSQLAPSAEACFLGPATGLARASHCLSAVSTFLSPLRLQRLVADTDFVCGILSLPVSALRSSSIARLATNLTD